MSLRKAIKALLDALILSERIKPAQDAKRRIFRKYRLREGLEKFATAVFYGVLRRMGIYDEKIKELTGSKNVYLLDETLRNALRLTFELLKYRTLSSKQRKLVRSVLAGEIRKRSHPYASMFFWDSWDTIKTMELVPRNKTEELVYKYFVSSLYIKKLSELIDDVEAYLQEVNKVPPIPLRVNTLKSSRKEIRKILQERNLRFTESPYLPHFKVYDAIDLETFQPFKEGKVFVQEEAAAMASLFLGPQPGQTIVDMAAAPGGKTVHLAELMENRGKIYAVDVDEERMERLKEIVRRAGVTIVEPVVMDGRDAPRELGEAFADGVLLDAPCTSSGTIQRNPELRWRIMEEDIRAFASLQRELLEASWKLLKPGGRLLYATCSIFREENEDNIEWFLKNHKEAKLLPIDGPYDEGLIPGTQRAWPHRHHTIGFFYALLEKEGGF